MNGAHVDERLAHAQVQHRLRRLASDRDDLLRRQAGKHNLGPFLCLDVRVILDVMIKLEWHELNHALLRM